MSKNQIIFGGNYFIEHLENTRCMITWYKHENMPDRTFANCEHAWTSFDKNSHVYSFLWDGFMQQDMANKEERHHSTQKPVELFKMILRDYAIKNNLVKVFDPFIGSGTTAVACKSLGLEWCGCELESDYVAIANKRLEAVQGSLF
jgi:site-specific DNA-methyltransferase (adenine-specific)